MKDKLLNGALKVRKAVGGLVPRQIVYVFGIIIGFLLYRLLGSRRKVAEENLKNSLALEERQTHKLTKRVFRNLGMMVAEILFTPSVSTKKCQDSLDVEGEEYLRAALEKPNSGVIIFSGHFGNWELMGGVLTALGYPINAIARVQNSALADKMLNEIRSQYGVKIFPRGVGLKGAYKALKLGETLLLLGDQEARGNGWFVDFFGRKASTFPGPVQLAQRTGATIVPVFLARVGAGRHKLMIYPGVTIPKDASNDQLVEYLQSLTSTLEEVIRQYPEQWFWIHRRWKSQP